MLSKPLKKPEFAIKASGADIVEPSTSKKKSGWQLIGGIPEKPPYQLFNYLHRYTYEWFQYLETITDNILDNQKAWFNTIVGDTSNDSSRYETLKEALEDVDVLPGSRILVTRNETINADSGLLKQYSI